MQARGCGFGCHGVSNGDRYNVPGDDGNRLGAEQYQSSAGGILKRGRRMQFAKVYEVRALTEWIAESENQVLKVQRRVAQVMSEVINNRDGNERQDESA